MKQHVLAPPPQSFAFSSRGGDAKFPPGERAGLLGAEKARSLHRIPRPGIPERGALFDILLAPWQDCQGTIRIPETSFPGDPS